MHLGNLHDCSGAGGSLERADMILEWAGHIMAVYQFWFCEANTALKYISILFLPNCYALIMLQKLWRKYSIYTLQSRPSREGTANQSIYQRPRYSGGQYYSWLPNSVLSCEKSRCGRHSNGSSSKRKNSLCSTDVHTKATELYYSGHLSIY